MGYGSRALKALNCFYSGEYFNLDEATPAEPSYPDASALDPVRMNFVSDMCEIT
jgi:N-acetyltransferase 10